MNYQLQTLTREARSKSIASDPLLKEAALSLLRLVDRRTTPHAVEEDSPESALVALFRSAVQTIKRMKGVLVE